MAEATNGAVNSEVVGGKRRAGRFAAFARACFVGAGLCAVVLPAPALSAGGAAPGAGGLCRDIVYADVPHVVCEIAPARYRGDLRIDLHWREEGAQPFGALGAVERALARQGMVPLVTMNAGMYELDLSPVGLFVADGERLNPLNLREGTGNFYLKPNGVFFMAGGKAGLTAGIAESRAFSRSNARPVIATQSGPLLVAKGRLHARFQGDGLSRKIRNGIGVRKDGTVVLAISRGGISFGRFARLFRDELRCPDALYLDGSVSQLSRDGEAGRGLPGAVAQWRPLGPILSVSARR